MRTITLSGIAKSDGLPLRADAMDYTDLIIPKSSRPASDTGSSQVLSKGLGDLPSTAIDTNSDKSAVGGKWEYGICV